MTTVNYTTIALASVVATSMAFYIIRKFVSRSKNYEAVAKVHKLFIYPIKSCKGIEVDHLYISKTGVRSGKVRDRQFVTVNKEKKLVNLVKARKLITIKVEIFNDNHLRLEDSSGRIILVEIKEHVDENDNPVQINGGVYGGEVKGLDCGDQVADWLANAIDLPGARLLQFVDDFENRPSRSSGKRSKEMEASYPIIYQNYSSVHLISLTSLNELNERIIKNSVDGGTIESVTHSHFRPNIFVDGAPPFDEDYWSMLKFNCELDAVDYGSPILFQLQNCERCVQTTVNRNNAIKAREPLRTLKTFRKPKHADDIKRLGEQPLFGCIFSTDREGEIRVADIIHSIRVKRI